MSLTGGCDFGTFGFFGLAAADFAAFFAGDAGFSAAGDATATGAGSDISSLIKLGVFKRIKQKFLSLNARTEKKGVTRFSIATGNEASLRTSLLQISLSIFYVARRKR
jgi:hypothetical protein